MSNGRQPALLDHLRSWLSPQTTALSDAELLSRYVADRDADAFTTLMQRHSRTVWGVCRHVLGHDHDAEDAFQATFLVLASKADSLRKNTSLASWLHGTAYHIASRARRDAATRRAHEQKGRSLPQTEVGAETAWRELSTLLDEELQALPVKQRTAFVLCVLEGKSLAEAARQLGWKEGTLSGTLSRAREQLRWRLARRGVSLSAILTGLALCGQSAAPAALAEKTLHAALSVATGQSASDVVSASVASLARGATRSFVVTKLHIGAFVLVAAALAAGVGGLASQKEAKERPAAQEAEQPKAEAAPPRRIDRYGDPLPSGALARLGTVRLRSGGFSGPVVFSADGKTLISASSNGVVHYWETATGKPLRSFRTISWAATDIALSPDRKLAAVAAMFNPTIVGLWETATGKLIRLLEVPAGGKAFRLAFSPDGKTLVSGGGADNKVCFWDVANGRLLRQVALKVGVTVLDFTPDGKTLVSKSPGWVHLWDPATGEERRRFQVSTNITHDYAFAPDGKLLVASRVRGIDLWNPTTGAKLGEIEANPHTAHTLAFSADGKTLALASSETIRCWDIAKRKEISRITEPPGPYVASLSFSPDGKIVACRGRDAAIRLWETATGKELQRNGGHWSGIRDVVFSPDGKLLATHAGDSAVRVWRGDTGEQRRTILADAKDPQTTVTALCFASDGKAVIFADNRGVLHVRNVDKDEEIRRFSVDEKGQRNEEFHVGALALSEDGKSLTALAHHRIFFEGNFSRSKIYALALVWNPTTGEQLRRREDATNATGRWTLSPDGKRWVSYNPGARVGVHDLATGQEDLALDGRCDSVWPVIFSPDGRLLAAVCHHGKAKDGIDDYRSSIVLWELATAAIVRRIELKAGSPEIALAFSPNGRILASGGDESVGLQLWDATNGKQLHRYANPGATVRSLSFDAARRLASGLADGTTLLWDAGPFTARAGPIPKKLTADALKGLWTDLADKDASKGHAALWTLAGGGEQSVAFLSEHLRPATVDVERIRRLIGDLDSDRFAVREAATQALEQLGSEAHPAMRQALEAKPSLEVRQRLQALLAGPKTVRSPAIVRQIRAVQVLEWIGSREARRHLQTLSDGAPEAHLTREAKAALERRTRR